MDQPKRVSQLRDRQELLELAVQCLGCRDDIQAKVARPFIYLVARHVRAAHNAQMTSLKRSELNARIEELKESATTLLTRLGEQETRQALSAIGSVPSGLEKDLTSLVDIAGKVPEKLDLKGRHGSDRAAHSFVFHARPLLVMYLVKLFKACSGEEPTFKDGRNNKFYDLLMWVWELATGECQKDGWQRHINAATRNFKRPKNLSDPVVFTGDGPGATGIFLTASMNASDLAQDFSESVNRRRRSPERQLPKKVQLA